MNCEKKNKIGASGSNDHGRTSSEAVALKEQEKLQADGRDFDAQYVGDGISRLVMKVRGGEIRTRSHLEFLPALQIDQLKNERPTYGPRS
jgi:hypothetical protein